MAFVLVPARASATKKLLCGHHSLAADKAQAREVTVIVFACHAQANTRKVGLPTQHTSRKRPIDERHHVRVVHHLIGDSGWADKPLDITNPPQAVATSHAPRAC